MKTATSRIPRVRLVETPASAPQYEVRVRNHGIGDSEIELWEMPSPATPHLEEPKRIAGLRGRNLELVEHRVFRRLNQAGVRLPRTADRVRAYNLPEDLALRLGLLFRALAPMRSRDRMRSVTEGIEAMGREEAAYWLGMALHRRNPRRVLTALRYLLTGPHGGPSEATNG
jgi:transposase InsO family protein